MGYKENKREYVLKYQKEKYTSVVFHLRKDNDEAVIDYLNHMPNKSNYLKELIQKDIDSMLVDGRIDMEALRKAIYHNSGWNFMCRPEYIEEINKYVETGDFNAMSPEALYQLNGIYSQVAQDYEYFSSGKYLPNIFAIKGKRIIDYSRFVQMYYRQAMKVLKKYKDYQGTIVDVSVGLKIPEEYMHEEPNRTMFLPDYLPNYDAPAEYIEEFMSYYSIMLRHLRLILLSKESLMAIYAIAIKSNVVVDEKQTLDFIKSLISKEMEILIENGILEK